MGDDYANSPSICLLLVNITSRASTTTGVASLSEKETVECPGENNSHDDTNNDDDEKLYIHNNLNNIAVSKVFR